MKTKNILITLVILTILIISVISAGYIFGFIPGSNSPENKPSNSISYSPSIPTSSNPPVAPFTTITFDFDRGTPTILEGQNTPIYQTSGGVTALFSSNSDPSSFSIQSYKTTFYTLTEFSDKYLFDNKISRDILYITFSQPITEITFTFASVEFHGPGHLEEPSTIKLTAYMNSIYSTPIDVAYANGNFSNSFYPQGTMSFNSNGEPFNLVKIELMYQINGGTDFLVDNIIVTTI